MMYAIDKDFEANLPENKFFKEFKFVNDDLSLVNDKGETVDSDGNELTIWVSMLMTMVIGEIRRQQV